MAASPAAPSCAAFAVGAAFKKLVDDALGVGPDLVEDNEADAVVLLVVPTV